MSVDLIKEIMNFVDKFGIIFWRFLFKSALLVFYQNLQHNLQKNKGSNKK